MIHRAFALRGSVGQELASARPSSSKTVVSQTTSTNVIKKAAGVAVRLSPRSRSTDPWWRGGGNRAGKGQLDLPRNGEMFP